MEIYGSEHVYEVAPPFLNNRQLSPEEMITFGLQGVSQPEADALERQTTAAFGDTTKDKAMEKVAELNLNLIKSKVKSINNLVVDGKKITTFDEFYKHAPKELVQWVCGAVMNTFTLTAAERKNFMPGSDSPS